MSKNEKINLSKRHKIALAVICGGLGVLLLVLGGYSEGREEDGKSAGTAAVECDAEEYARQTEARVSALCAKVAGAGDVSVFVSLKGGYRTVYAFDTQSTSSGYKSEIVMSGSGADKGAVVSAYENPEIAGIGVVCEGGDDAQVREQIISLIAASLGIGTNKIFVAAG